MSPFRRYFYFIWPKLGFEYSNKFISSINFSKLIPIRTKYQKLAVYSHYVNRHLQFAQRQTFTEWPHTAVLECWKKCLAVKYCIIDGHKHRNTFDKLLSFLDRALFWEQQTYNEKVDIRDTNTNTLTSPTYNCPCWWLKQQFDRVRNLLYKKLVFDFIRPTSRGIARTSFIAAACNR